MNENEWFTVVLRVQASSAQDALTRVLHALKPEGEDLLIDGAYASEQQPRWTPEDARGPDVPC